MSGWTTLARNGQVRISLGPDERVYVEELDMGDGVLNAVPMTLEQAANLLRCITATPVGG